MLTFYLGLAFWAAIRLSLYFEYAELYGFTKWEIMGSLTIYFDTIDSVLILNFKIDFPTLKPLSTAACSFIFPNKRFEVIQVQSRLILNKVNKLIKGFFIGNFI